MDGTVSGGSSRLLRLSEAARYLGVGRTTLYELVRNKVLDPISLPGLRGLRFDRTDVDRLVDRGKSKKLGGARHG